MGLTVTPSFPTSLKSIRVTFRAEQSREQACITTMHQRSVELNHRIPNYLWPRNAQPGLYRLCQRRKPQLDEGIWGRCINRHLGFRVGEVKAVSFISVGVIHAHCQTGVPKRRVNILWNEGWNGMGDGFECHEGLYLVLWPVRGQ